MWTRARCSHGCAANFGPAAAQTGSGESLGYALEAQEYLQRYGREGAVDRYLELIREAKRSVGVPVRVPEACTAARRRHTSRPERASTA